jgi:predicted GNAT family N-acyltransferase
MKFVEITWRSEFFRQELQLRDRLLRAPLGLAFDAAELDAEQHQLHFGILDGQSILIACVVAVPLDPSQAKIRQMVVDEPYQRQGIGTSLLEKTEAELAQRGFQSIELNARDLATAFYEKLGYRVAGEPFIEVTIPHQTMIKQL